jgi:hypothetical protein
MTPSTSDSADVPGGPIWPRYRASTGGPLFLSSVTNGTSAFRRYGVDSATFGTLALPAWPRCDASSKKGASRNCSQYDIVILLYGGAGKACY